MVNIHLDTSSEDQLVSLLTGGQHTRSNCRTTSSYGAIARTTQGVWMCNAQTKCTLKIWRDLLPLICVPGIENGALQCTPPIWRKDKRRSTSCVLLQAGAETTAPNVSTWKESVETGQRKQGTEPAMVINTPKLGKGKKRESPRSRCCCGSSGATMSHSNTTLEVCAPNEGARRPCLLWDRTPRGHCY